MRIGGDPVGGRGLALLGVTAVVGGLLAGHGWSGRHAGLTPGSLAGSGSSASVPAHSGPTPAASAASASAPASRSAAPKASTQQKPAGNGAASAAAGPLLSSQAFASEAFQVWPGALSATAQTAMTGLSIAVHRTSSGLSVVAGVVGQPSPAAHSYPGGARVYVIEASLGDDSGSSDYNLGDDGLVVTDSKGEIVQ
jgi:hypothetical protein